MGYRFVDSQGIYREEDEIIHRCEVNEYRSSEYRTAYIVLSEYYAGRKFDPKVQWNHLEDVSRVMKNLGDKHPSWYLEIEELAAPYFDAATARRNYRVLYTILYVVSWRISDRYDRCWFPRNMREWPDDANA